MTRSLAALLLCALLGPPQGQERPADQAPPPTAEEVAAAQSALDEALRAADLARIQTALEAAAKVPHASVVRRLTRLLDDERPPVRLATIQSLRWIAHPDAVDALHAATRRRDLMKDPEQAAALLRAVAQHADPRSVAVLARTPFEPDTFACKRARLFGLGRIRTPESLEALIGILGVTGTGPNAKRRIQDQMGDARTALIYLTGTDQGLSPEIWEEWWRKSRRELRLPEKPPMLPEEMQDDWDLFFGFPQSARRPERREERGR